MIKLEKRESLELGGPVPQHNITTNLLPPKASAEQMEQLTAIQLWCSIIPENRELRRDFT